VSSVAGYPPFRASDKPVFRLLNQYEGFSSSFSSSDFGSVGLRQGLIIETATPVAKTETDREMTEKQLFDPEYCYPLTEGYAPFKVSYTWRSRIQNDFDEYGDFTAEFFDHDDNLFTSGWRYELEGLEPADHGNGEQWLRYACLTTGLSRSLLGALEAAKNVLPPRAWPFMSHQVSGNRERFHFALELERVHGVEHLHEAARAGSVDRFSLSSASISEDLFTDWESYE